MSVSRVSQVVAVIFALSLAGLATPALAQSGPFDLNGLEPQVQQAVQQARAAQTQALQAAARAQGDASGTIRFTGDGGDTYQGEGHRSSSDGPMRNGYGLMTWSDGEYYAGESRAAAANGGQKHGYGVYVFANGNVYEGQFQADRYHGYGVMWEADGRAAYAGRFSNGQPVP